MPNFISPLDDTYIRFDAAADILAKAKGTVTADSMLEMLTLAMWRGAFDPPDRKDEENWLFIPIEQPRVLLTDGQRALKPLPVEYYGAARATIISVMYCSDFLPGERSGWASMLERRDNLTYLHDKESAFQALPQMPLRSYSEDGKSYLCSIYIPRAMLQGWLDRRSQDFCSLFIPSGNAFSVSGSSPANDTKLEHTAPKRGRPRMPAWEFIKIWAFKLKADHPDIQNKELAGRLYERAATLFDEKDMPSEATIVRQLAKILRDPPPTQGNA